MTKYKIISFSLISAFLLLILSTLVGFGQSFPITYGTYNYWGTKSYNGNTQQVIETENAKVDLNGIGITATNFEFKQGGTVRVTRGNEIFDLNYTVDSNGNVNLSGNGVKMLTVYVYGSFSNHGYFENNKFYFRYSYNENSKIETYIVAELNI